MDIPESSFDLNAVPEKLLNGTSFTSWDEENISYNNNFRVDKYGFFLYWRVQDDKEGNCIDLSTVSEVRSGYIPKDTKVREVLVRTGHDTLEQRMLTVVYNTSLVDVSFLHLCANNARTAKEWLEGLSPLLYDYRINNINIMTQLFKQYVKASILSSTLGTISVKGICKALNTGKLELSVLNGLRDLGLSSGKNDEMCFEDMSFENFYQLYLKVCPRLEIDQLCVKWGGGRAPYLTVNQLVKFLNEEQRDPRLNEILYPYYDKEKAMKIIRKYEKSIDMLQRDRISVNGLTRYLLSEDTALLKSDQLQLRQDMNQPIPHYFINSSHNTYLIGRQFGGRSSVEMYRQCLIAGCRCIELDCWDGPNDEPLITHGNAMCTKVSFKDVIEAIRDSAFITTDFPVILSFENHCSKQQQYKMASYCVDILGDALVTKPLDSWPLEEGSPLPSPNQLRGRILIKNKKLKPEQEAEGESSYDFSDLESMCATLRRDSGSLKETAIVDDNVETIETKEDNKETNEKENSEDNNEFPNEQKRLSQVELSDILQFSSKVTSDIIEKAANVVREKSKKVNNVKRQCHTVSEYSYLLKQIDDSGLKNGLDDVDSALNHLKEVDISHFSTSDYYDKVSNCSCSDCEGEPDTMNSINETNYCVKCSHYVIRKRGSSVNSASSIDSDISQSGSEKDCINNSNVTVVVDGEHALNSDGRIDDTTPTPSPYPSPVTTPTKDITINPITLFTANFPHVNGNSNTPSNDTTTSYVRKDSNGKISSQSSSTTTTVASTVTLSKETRSSSVSSTTTHTSSTSSSTMRTSSTSSSATRTSSISSSTSLTSQSTISDSVNGERKDSDSSMSSDVVERKESIASSNSIELNGDEDEERDVVGTLMKQDKNFGSSLRINVMPKKGSRSASLTPEEFELISSFQSQSTTGNINPFLSSLVNYIQPVPFQGFEEAEEKNVSYHMSSFNETTGFQLVKTSPGDFVKYNKRQLSRIYPKGSRVDSSNYNPQVFWNVGCQMVSLNFQTPDLAYQLNQGKFEMNGSCGYILKPDFMIRKDKQFDPFTESVIDGCVAAYLAVKVISGQFLSDKKITTLVEVDLCGLPTDTLRKKYKTKMSTSKGLNTVYEEEEFVFRRVVMPELALLRLGVVDDNDKLLAQRIVPLNALQAGYRHIPLRTETGYCIPLGTLFVHITLRSYVPEGYGDIVDELSEPIKYQSAAEKRASQMVMFEILDDPDDGEILPSYIKKSNSDNALSKMKSSSISLTSLNSTSSSASLPQFNNRPRESIVTLSYMGPRSGSELALHLMESNVPKKFEMKHAPISQEELKKDKTYRKALKRQQKEVETLLKKYSKERNSMQKTHTYQLEQLITAFEENKQAAYKNYERASRRCGEEKTAALKVYEKKILYQSQLQRDEANKTLSAQTDEWTAMIDKQMVEEMEIYEKHSETQTTLLKSAMKEIHEMQVKDLKIKHERENAEIKKKQTKQSIEQSKLLLSDKSIKSKEERDRKQRERDRQNFKHFAEERKKLETRQTRELDELKIRHEEEQQNLEQEMKKAVKEKNEEIQANGEKLRKAIRSPYQTLLPTH